MSPKIFALFKRKFLFNKGVQVTTTTTVLNKLKCEKDGLYNEIKGNTFNFPDNLATQISETFIETIDQKNIDRTKYKKKNARPSSLHGSGNRYKLNNVKGCNACKNMQHSFRRKNSNIKTTNVSVNNSIILTAHNTELYKKTEVKCKCPCKRSKQIQANPKIEDCSRKSHKIEGISLDGDCNIIDKNYRKRTEIDEEPIENYKYDNEKIECKKKQQTGDFESPFEPQKKTKTCLRTEKYNEICFGSDIKDLNKKYSMEKERCNCISELIYKTKPTHTGPKGYRIDNNTKGDYKIDHQKSCHSGEFHKKHVPNQFCDCKSIKASVEVPDLENKRDNTECPCIETRGQNYKTKLALREQDPCRLDNDIEEDIPKNKRMNEVLCNNRKFNEEGFMNERGKNISLEQFEQYGEDDQTEDFKCPCTIYKKQLYNPQLEQPFHTTGRGFDNESFDGNLIEEKQNSRAKLQKLKQDLEKLLKELKKTQSKNNCCCNEKSNHFTDQTSDGIIDKEPERYSNTYNRKRKINKCQDGSNDAEKKCTHSFLNTDRNCDTESYQSADHPDCNIEKYCGSRDIMNKSQDSNKNAEEISNQSYRFDDPSADINFEEESEQHIDPYISRDKINEFKNCSINSKENTDRFCKRKSPLITRQNTNIEDETERCIKTCNQKDKTSKAQDYSNDTNDLEENCKSYPYPHGTLSSRSSISYYGAQTSSSDLGNTAISKSCYSPNLPPNCFSSSTYCDDKTESCEDEESYLDAINKLIMKGPGLLKNAIKCICTRGIPENLRSEDLVTNKVKWYEELKNKQEHELASCFKKKPTSHNKVNRLKSKKSGSAGLKLKKVGQIIPFMKGLKISLRHMSKPFI